MKNKYYKRLIIIYLVFTYLLLVTSKYDYESKRHISNNDSFMENSNNYVKMIIEKDNLSNLYTNFSVRNNKNYLNVKTYDGSNQAVHPDIVYFKNGFNGYKYYLAYTPYPKGNEAFENPCITASNDGEHFTKIARNPLVDPPKNVRKGGHYSDTDLIFVKDKLQLFYVYNLVGKIGPAKFYMIESKNGTRWSKPTLVYKGEPYKTSVSPTLVYDKTTQKYRMWFVESYKGKKIVYTESKNLKDWSTPIKCNLNIYQGSTWHIDIIKHKNLFYGLIDAISKVNGKRYLYLAQSSDGLKWFATQSPILSPKENSWDSCDIYRSTFIMDEDRIKIWYSARNKKNIWHLGSAIIKYRDPVKDLII